MTIRRDRRKLARRRAVRFWILAVALCVATAFAALGVKLLGDWTGSAKFHRYEPVDVPPAEVSPRHGFERMEYDRRFQELDKEEKKE